MNNTLMEVSLPSNGDGNSSSLCGFHWHCQDGGYIPIWQGWSPRAIRHSLTPCWWWGTTHLSLRSLKGRLLTWPLLMGLGLKVQFYSIFIQCFTGVDSLLCVFCFVRLSFFWTGETGLSWTFCFHPLASLGGRLSSTQTTIYEIKKSLRNSPMCCP